MICINCNSIQLNSTDGNCPKCSALLVKNTQKNLQTLVSNRFSELLDKWHRTGKISSSTFDEIKVALKSETEPVQKKHRKEKNFSFDTWFVFFSEIQNFIFLFFQNLFEPLLIKPETLSKRKRIRNSDDNEIFDPEESNFSGISIFSEIEKSFRSEKKNPSKEFILAGIKPLFNEYIWWFIGTILVFIGSILGIREAWNSLEGVSKLVTILSSLVVYQFLFAGLGVFLSKKSNIAARILSGISIILLPVSFSIAVDIILANIFLGFIILSLLSASTIILLLMIREIFLIERFIFIMSLLQNSPKSKFS